MFQCISLNMFHEKKKHLYYETLVVSACVGDALNDKDIYIISSKLGVHFIVFYYPDEELLLKLAHEQSISSKRSCLVRNDDSRFF